MSNRNGSAADSIRLPQHCCQHHTLNPVVSVEEILEKRRPLHCSGLESHTSIWVHCDLFKTTFSTSWLRRPQKPQAQFASAPFLIGNYCPAIHNTIVTQNIVQNRCIRQLEGAHHHIHIAHIICTTSFLLSSIWEQYSTVAPVL